MPEENNGNNADNVDDKKTPVDEPKKTEMVPKSRLDQVISQKNEMADTLTGLVDELKADIPEEYQNLIPDTKPQDQIKWIRNATQAGLFTKSKESGPDSKAPNKNKLDFSNMKTSEKIKHGYKH